MQSALKQNWTDGTYNLKLFVSGKQFGVKKVKDGQEWSWRGSYEVDAATRVVTLKPKHGTTPDLAKSKKLKDKERATWTLTFAEDFASVTGTLDGVSVTLKTQEKDELADEDLDL